MKTLLKSFLIGLVMFLVHLLLQWTLMSGESFGSYGVLGRLIFGLAFFIWFYWLFCYLYVILKRKLESYHYAIVFITVIFLYVAFRIPDIINDNFIKHFRPLMFLVILGSSYILHYLYSFFLRNNCRIIHIIKFFIKTASIRAKFKTTPVPQAVAERLKELEASTPNDDWDNFWTNNVWEIQDLEDAGGAVVNMD